MHLRPEHYLAASTQQITEARKLLKLGNFSGAIYLAGASAECMFRAYRCLKDNQFDSRHDLPHLLTQSGMAEYLPVEKRKKLGAALGILWARWKNDYRYASDDRILAAFRAAGLTRNIKGDHRQQLKTNATMAVEAAFEIWTEGNRKWPSKKK